MQPAVTRRRVLLAQAIAALAAVGALISAVALYHHYGTEQSSFCDLGGKLNCDIVNRSIYSTLFGVPVALIGVIGYGVVFYLAISWSSRPQSARILFAGSAAGLVFALYLTYIEGFVLGTWCVLCLSSLVLIFLITVTSAVLARKGSLYKI